MQPGPIVRRVTVGAIAPYHSVEGSLPQRLSIVVRAGCASQKAETIPEWLEAAKRVGEAVLEPAQHARADTAKNSTGTPGIT